MDVETAPLKQRTCMKCGYLGETNHTLCPKCNRLLQTVTSVRVRGALLIMCGLFLIAFIGYISIWAAGLVFDPVQNGAKFTGTKDQLMVMFVLFGSLIVFGLISLATGLWQLIFGKRNRYLVWIMLGITGVLVIIGVLVKMYF